MRQLRSFYLHKTQLKIIISIWKKNIFIFQDLPQNPTLRKKCQYSEFFWSLFSCILTEYGPEKLRIQKLFTQCHFCTLGEEVSGFAHLYIGCEIQFVENKFLIPLLSYSFWNLKLPFVSDNDIWQTKNFNIVDIDQEFKKENFLFQNLWCIARFGTICTI